MERIVLSPGLSPILFSSAHSPIDARLDVVEGELTSYNLKRLTDVRDALRVFNKVDFDKLIASVTFTVMLIERTESIPSLQVGSMRDPCL